jgi:VCBS repeat-containing protein
MGFNTGDNITLTYFNPTLNTTFAGPTAAIVNNSSADDFEFTNFAGGLFDLDVDFDTVTVVFRTGFTFGTNPFNGWVLGYSSSQTGGAIQSATPSTVSNNIVTTFNNLNLSVNWSGYTPTVGSRITWRVFPPQSIASPLVVPTGNINERTGISINTSGSFQGSGTFGISNSDQSGNAGLKYGKYGSLVVDTLTGAFNYSPDQSKIKPLKTGETGVDEFTITLTGANNAVTSSTYRVEIIGDTGSDNGGGGDVKPDNKSITIAGSRGTVSGKSGIIIDGDTTDLAAGSTVKPYIRFPGQTEYSLGSARPTVDANGDFSWQRKTGKKAYVYFTDDSGDVISNRVVIPAGEARLSSSSLQAFDSDPIVGGSSNQYAAHKKGKRRRPVAAASFGNQFNEDTTSSLLMATGTTDSGFFKQHDLVAASSGNW